MPLNMIRKTFKYYLKPTARQRRLLERQLETLRQLYNAALQERRSAWETCRKSVNYYDQANQLKEIRGFDEDLRAVNFSATQDCLRRVQKTFDAFFRRIKSGDQAGYPRFKGRERYDSMTFPSYGDGVKLKDRRLYIQNVGHVKIKRHRPIDGTIKTITIKREGSRWYACFSVECETNPLPPTGKAIGIDVNLENFLTTSDGEVVENPRWLRRAEKTIVRLQRAVSRKKRGSNRRKKAVARWQEWHRKIQDQRRDFHHKLSRRLVNGNDAIFFEDLNIAGMVKNKHLAKSIADVGWGQFLTFTTYKAAEAGRLARGNKPHFTTQTCWRCGARVKKGLSQRWHWCWNCGEELPRDHNSAKNILAVGLTVTARGGMALAAPMNRETVEGCTHVLPSA